VKRLAATGAETGELVLSGALLVIAGAALLGVSRRADRSTRTSSPAEVAEP
jgi:LPXTG-motif cell wall-anchored protein